MFNDFKVGICQICLRNRGKFEEVDWSQEWESKGKREQRGGRGLD